MSTLKSINVQHPSASTINIVNDASGNVTIGNNLTVTGTYITPIIAGGTTASSTLTLESTTGAGTTDSILFKTGSQSTRMTIDTSGNVGIGTSSPSSILNVVKATSSGTYRTEIRLDNNDQRTTIASYYQSGVAQRTIFGSQGVSGGTATPIAFEVGSTEAMRIDTSGNVGIGTSSPTGKLHIYNSTSGSPAILNINSVDGGGGTTGIYFRPYQTAAQAASSPAQATIYAIDDNYSAAITFNTKNTGASSNPLSERMRIDANGDLLIGTTGAFLSNTSSFAFSTYYQYSVFNKPSTSPAGSYYIFFGYNGGTIGSITQNGTTGVLYNIASDQRLKTNIIDAPTATSVIDAIQIRSFDWRSDSSHNRYGIIAQELVQIVPEAVHVPVDEKDMMGVDYSKLVPILIKAFQELSAKNDALEARLAKLEGTV